MPNYNPSTMAKINYLDNLILQNPEWGSSRLQNAIVEKYGSALKKNYLLKEAREFRESQKIEQPKTSYFKYSQLNKVLRQGNYLDFEIKHIKEQVKLYTPEGLKNFANSETFKSAAEQHAAWLQTLLADAMKITGNLQQARDIVETRLKLLNKNAQYDPFTLLQEQEKAETIISGVIKIKPLKRDYTEDRRRQAQRKRDLVRQKVLNRR